MDYKVFKWSQKAVCSQHITPKSIVEAAKSLLADTDFENIHALDPKHVIVDLSTMHYGMGDKNPLDSVKFYSKHNPRSKPGIPQMWASDFLTDTHLECQMAGPGDFSTLMPAEFGELHLHIYTRDSRYASYSSQKSVTLTIFLV